MSRGERAVIPARAPSRLRRFFGKPKGLLILVLVAFVALAALGNPAGVSLLPIAAAVGVAMTIDLIWIRLRQRKWRFPDGALLSGLFVAMILGGATPWPIAAAASAVAIISKYVFRVRRSNIFNPAALALWFAYAVFHSAESWWGALPEFRPPAFECVTLAVLISTGLLLADRVRRLPAALAFLGAYYLCLTATAYIGDPSGVAPLFRSADLHAAIFCGFFMVTDPPTSPSGSRDQFVFGCIAGATSYVASQLLGSVIFFVVGVLAGNAWEAWRRARAHSPAQRRREHAVVT